MTADAGAPPPVMAHVLMLRNALQRIAAAGGGAG